MRVLIVDDDTLMLKMTRFIVERAGYDVITATDSETALTIAQLQSPDLIVLDVGMPNMSGFELCKSIRERMKVPIIFLTGHDTLNERIDGLQSGGDDYVVKPYHPDELVARIQALLRRYSSQNPSPLEELTVGNLTAVPLEQSVRLPNGRTCALTPNEFRLLYFLMRHANQPQPISVILKAIWGYEDEGANNLVAVHVRRLRQKIEEIHDQPRYIKTVPGMGYRFEA